PSTYIENKKFLFVINSILYQNGMKLLATKFLGLIINTLFENTNLVGRVYTFEEIFTLYKDFITLNDNKITILKDFSTFLLKMANKVEEIIYIENIEWILYKLYIILEHSKSLTDKDQFLLKSIYNEFDINFRKYKNKSFVLINLFEILSKKF